MSIGVVLRCAAPGSDWQFQLVSIFSRHCPLERGPWRGTASALTQLCTGTRLDQEPLRGGSVQAGLGPLPQASSPGQATATLRHFPDLMRFKILMTLQVTLWGQQQWEDSKEGKLFFNSSIYRHSCRYRCARELCWNFHIEKRSSEAQFTLKVHLGSPGDGKPRLPLTGGAQGLGTRV